MIYEQQGSEQRNYIYNGLDLIGMVKNNQIYTIHSDHLGRPEVVTNINDQPVWQAQNKAFDRTVLFDQIGGLNIGFPGQYWDSEKGSWYNHHRDYDANLGRYLQSDPLGLIDGPNTYGYAYQNPLINIDPDGRLVCGGFCVAAIGIGVGFAFDAAIDAIRGEDNSSAATVANAAGGGSIAATLPTQQKSRTGVSGGGPAGDRTSVASQQNHQAYKDGRRSLRTRHLVTKGLRKVPYIGTGLGIAELLDAIYDRYNDKDPCER